MNDRTGQVWNVMGRIVLVTGPAAAEVTDQVTWVHHPAVDLLNSKADRTTVEVEMDDAAWEAITSGLYKRIA